MSLRKDIDKLLKTQAEDDKILVKIWDRISKLENAFEQEKRRLAIQDYQNSIKNCSSWVHCKGCHSYD